MSAFAAPGSGPGGAAAFSVLPAPALARLSLPDALADPSVPKYVSALVASSSGGAAESEMAQAAARALATGYVGYPQMCALAMDWLDIALGAEPTNATNATKSTTESQSAAAAGAAMGDEAPTADASASNAIDAEKRPAYAAASQFLRALCIARCDGARLDLLLSNCPPVLLETPLDELGVEALAALADQFELDAAHGHSADGDASSPSGSSSSSSSSGGKAKAMTDDVDSDLETSAGASVSASSQSGGPSAKSALDRELDAELPLLGGGLASITNGTGGSGLTSTSSSSSSAATSSLAFHGGLTLRAALHSVDVLVADPSWAPTFLLLGESDAQSFVVSSLARRAQQTADDAEAALTALGAAASSSLGGGGALPGAEAGDGGARAGVTVFSSSGPALRTGAAVSAQSFSLTAP